MRRFLLGLAAHAATAAVTLAIVIYWFQSGAAELSVHRIELSDGHANSVRLLPDMVSIDNSNGSLFLLATDPPHWTDGPALIGMPHGSDLPDREVFLRVGSKSPNPKVKVTSFRLAAHCVN